MSVGGHYSRGGLWQRIEAAITASGLDANNLKVEDLAALDQFHSRGRLATRDLAAISGIEAGMNVLDVGGGLGGPARTLASTVGCRVEVLDLTEEFCLVGRELTSRTGLSDLVSFTHGDALDLPFGDAGFDAVWTQHSTMNIPDKGKLYGEIRRVLSPGGRLAMHEVFAGVLHLGRSIRFPVPWAREPSTSHLVTQEESRAIIASAGLRKLSWTDETSETAAWFAERATATKVPQPLGLQLVLGPSFGEMLRNQTDNLAEGCITVARAIFEADAS